MPGAPRASTPTTTSMPSPTLPVTQGLIEIQVLSHSKVSTEDSKGV